MTATTPEPISARIGGLLTDEQLRQFIVQGYVKLRVDLPREVHETIYRKVDELTLNRGHVGNNVYPGVPELREVYEHPAVRGALASVLGPTCVMHQHRYLHANQPGQNTKAGWHKDSYWGYTRKMRTHRPWWAMIMYYPQDTAVENGPTAVLPGRQHYLHRAEGDDRGHVTVTGEAGTFFLIAYDLWHAAWPNMSQTRRYMSKFEFMRLDAPKVSGGPTWDCGDRAWREPAEHTPPFRHPTMWRMLWDWLADNRTQLPGAGVVGEDVAALLGRLGDANETDRLNAVYELAAAGEPAVRGLRNALLSDDETVRLHAAFAFGAMGQAAEGTLQELASSDATKTRAAAAFALGELRDPSPATIKLLTTLTRDADPITRLLAVEALGTLGPVSRDSVPALAERLRDDELEVAMFAAIALARVGRAAEEATPELIRCLRSPNRYVRGHAIEALQRIGTPAAVNAAIDELKATRWCPITTVDSPFYP
jgi:hypothetical protein